MTAQLYFDDPLRLEFTAEVEQVIPLADGRFGAILKGTYFYPTSGGQEHDTGTLGAARVLDVYKEDERIVHVLDRPVAVGPQPARIDRERRIRNMQHHTAQHILSAAFLSALDLPTVSANINGDSPSTIDLEAGEVAAEDLERVERAANAVVFEDRVVKSYLITDADVPNIPFRRAPKVTGSIRVVEVDGFDYSPCGGTHCPRTGMIGLIKILRIERVNKKTRVHFVAGFQALERMRAMRSAAQRSAALLNGSVDGLPAAALRLREEAEAVRADLELVKAEGLKMEAARLVAAAGPGKRVAALFRGRSSGELRQLAGELRGVEGVSALLATIEAERVTLVAACHSLSGRNANELLQRALAVLHGRGGGDAELAQGGGGLGAVTPDELEAALRDILR